nr:hypothetical protein WI23_28420 [Burkholderia oklahomensis C6786]
MRRALCCVSGMRSIEMPDEPGRVSATWWQACATSAVRSAAPPARMRIRPDASHLSGRAARDAARVQGVGRCVR